MGAVKKTVIQNGIKAGNKFSPAACVRLEYLLPRWHRLVHRQCGYMMNMHEHITNV